MVAPSNWLPPFVYDRRRDMESIYIKNRWLPYLLILPMVVLICVFKLYPIFSSIIVGFQDFDGAFTLDNYKVLFEDATFWNSVKVTIKFNVIIIPLQIIVSFIMALLVNVRTKGIELFRTIYYLPFCISLTVATVIWQMMLNINNGVVNSMLGILGIEPIGFLIDQRYALLSIIVIASWRGCPYWMMFFLAGLKGIDSGIYEAAKIDGASFFDTIFRVTIPMLKNTLLFVLVANTTANFLLFAPIQIATDGGPQGSTNVLMYEAYKAAFKYSNAQRQACIVTILLVIIVICCLIQNRAMKEKE